LAINIKHTAFTMAGEENNDSSGESEVDSDVKAYTTMEVMRTGLLLVHYTVR